MIEDHGVFIFKNTFKQGEISGFCLQHAEFPVIMVNNSTTKTRQIFSVLHEFIYILLHRSAISTFDESRIEELPMQDRRIERFCNAMAAEILVPIADFREQVAQWTVEPEGASDDDFAALANRYHVARAVVLRRFLDEKRVSAEFYERKAKGWDEQRTKKDAGGNFYSTQNVYYSERFLREVYARYTRRLLSKDEAADLIGIAPKNFEKLGDLVQRGGRGVIYVFDTNSFSELNAYYPDIFKSFWTKFNKLVDDCKVTSTRKVITELERSGLDHIVSGRRIARYSSHRMQRKPILSTKFFWCRTSER